VYRKIYDSLSQLEIIENIFNLRIFYIDVFASGAKYSVIYAEDLCGDIFR
jgi:hypothetical protein